MTETHTMLAAKGVHQHSCLPGLSRRHVIARHRTSPCQSDSLRIVCVHALICACVYCMYIYIYIYMHPLHIHSHLHLLCVWGARTCAIQIRTMITYIYAGVNACTHVRMCVLLWQLVSARRQHKYMLECACTNIQISVDDIGA